MCATSKGSDQRSLMRAFASRLNILRLLSYRLNRFGVSKLKGRRYMLVWVYSCQNATLLEISCRSSNCVLTSVAVNALYLLLTVPWVGLWSAIVAFPRHAHLLFNPQSFSNISVKDEKLRIQCPSVYSHWYHSRSKRCLSSQPDIAA